MNIIVCVKQIPDPETPASSFKVDEAAKKVIPAQGIAPVVNPFDPQATEAALRLRDTTGSGKVTVISLGPDSARDAIKHALAMGADEGVLLNDPSFEGIDNFQTAVALSKAIQKVGEFDLVLTGRSAADWDMGVVPQGLGQLLSIPVVTIAKSIEANGNTIKVQRVLDDGFQTVEVPTPALVSVSNEFGEPRYPQLRQIMLAAKKTVQVWSAADIGLDGNETGAANRWLPLEALYVPKVESNVEIIEGDSPEEKAKNLAQKLRAAKLI
ncbi:MAG TPA: electron transfer flavoprotein subunit beta/FixA family protein [Tepidiformaceae bacterium]|nr:electron transfer flavoprotein subunit beta/FixA family protein [Tepidiformaceae bacterium]